MRKVMNYRYYVVLLLCFVTTSCANTKMTQHWLLAEHERPYQHPLIIGISDSQQTRQIYEKHFVSELKKQNIMATASYTIINSKQKMNRETVINAIQGTNIDAVIVSYLVSSETEVKYHESPLSQGYSGDVEHNRISDTLVSTRGRTSNTEIITLKNDLYDARTKSLVWSSQTRTVAPESIDAVVVDVTALLIEQMLSDKVLK